MNKTLQPTVVLTPVRAAAPISGTFDVLVRVQAPDRPEGAASPARLPLRLALVIDRSGSMSGQPLQEALRCAEYIAAGLQPTDQVAVVLYDNQVQVAMPLRPAGDAHAVRSALVGVESGGTTALFDGWQTGASVLEGGDGTSISRVLLLSDGQANQGLCDVPAVEQHCVKCAAGGVTTTTVGLGRSFNEDLMIAMARAGGGQHYYGQTAQDLHDSFDEELSLLQSLFMRKLRLRLVPGSGVIAEPLGIVQSASEGWHGLPDLAWGAEAWMLVRLHIAKTSAPDPRALEALLAVVLEGELQDGGLTLQLNGMLSLPLVNASDLAGMPADELVLRRLKEVEFARAAAEISRTATAGDIESAQASLNALAAQVADHPWLAEKVKRLDALLERDAVMAVKEMEYSRMRTARRLVSKSEVLFSASETESADVPAFLRRKGSEGEGRKRPK